MNLEKERLLTIARNRKAMERKQREFSIRLKEAATSGNKEALTMLIDGLNDSGMDMNDPVVSIHTHIYIYIYCI